MRFLGTSGFKLIGFQFFQRPARQHPDGESFRATCPQPPVTGASDHGAVIGTELRPRIEDASAFMLHEAGEPFAQALVGTDATGHHQASDAGFG